MGPVTSGISYMRLRELLESGFTSRAARFGPLGPVSNWPSPGRLGAIVYRRFPSRMVFNIRPSLLLAASAC